MSETGSTIHATAVSAGGSGVLLRGPAGIGKSDLALRLIDRGALLVADDRVEIVRRRDAIFAAPPGRLRGWLSIAGLGPTRFPFASETRIALVCDLEYDPPRHPLERPTEPLLGVPLRRLRLDPRAASAPLMIEAALRALAEGTPPPFAD